MCDNMVIKYQIKTKKIRKWTVLGVMFDFVEMTEVYDIKQEFITEDVANEFCNKLEESFEKIKVEMEKNFDQHDIMNWIYEW